MRTVTTRVLGAGPDTIWRIEGGDYKQLRPATMRRIAAALGESAGDVSEFAAICCAVSPHAKMGVGKP
jgi:hypothetical protein